MCVDVEVGGGGGEVFIAKVVARRKYRVWEGERVWDRVGVGEGGGTYHWCCLGSGMRDMEKVVDCWLICTR